jgi:hypothetical protein
VNQALSALRLPLLFGALLLAGCNSKSYCMREQRYDHVPSIPPITGGEGLNIPNSPTALRVPPAAPNAPNEPFGSTVVDPKHPGRTQYACLDEPPPLPPNADATATGGTGQ